MLDDLAEEIEPGMAYEAASNRLADYGIEDDSAALARLATALPGKGWVRGQSGHGSEPPVGYR